jgi:phage baseplate assembly protein W
MQRAIVLPFSIDSSGSILSSNDPRVIWQSRVTAAVMTEMGERVFRPEYGGKIKEALFQNSTDAANLVEASIQGVFKNYLPYLVLNNVRSSMDTQSGVLSLTIDYTLPNKEKAQISLTTGTLTRSGEIIQEY